LALVERQFGRIMSVLVDPWWKTSDADLTDVLDAFAALHTSLRWPDGVDCLGGEPDDEGLPKRMVV
jgi:hypothetical protein